MADQLGVFFIYYAAAFISVIASFFGDFHSKMKPGSCRFLGDS